MRVANSCPVWPIGHRVRLACALVVGGRFLQWAWVLYRGAQPHAAINTFKYSILYLLLLFIALLIDHYLVLNL